MFRLIIRACFGGKVNFKTVKRNGYEAQLYHDNNNFRSWLITSWIPYFWDSDISFDLLIKTPNDFRQNTESWNYYWELRDLDGEIIAQNKKDKKGHGSTLLTNKGFRKWFGGYWNVKKGRAIVLGNLHPHKEYILYVDFNSDCNGKTGECIMATFSIEDRTTWQNGLFLILFTIFMTILVGLVARACGANPIGG